MASAESKDFAKRLVREKLPGTGRGKYWPKLNEEAVAAGLIARVDDPDLMYQSASNICGMASFCHDLAESDPVQYVWLAIYLFIQASGKLGRGAQAIVVTASIECRSSPLPNNMNHADWVIMASLRDYSNAWLKYRYDAKIPVLGDIPIIGPLFRSWMAEPIAGINWPDDLEKLLKAAGFTKVVNAASVTAKGGYRNLILSGEYWAAGYQVMWLISNAMLEGGSGTPIAEHWVTLESKIEENLWAFKGAASEHGVNFTIFNPANHRKYKVPEKYEYMPLAQATNNFFGFVAARLK
jgi:hypothetical protein